MMEKTRRCKIWTPKIYIWWRNSIQIALGTSLNMHLMKDCFGRSKASSMHLLKCPAFLDTSSLDLLISTDQNLILFSFQGKIAGGLEDDLLLEVLIEREMLQTLSRLNTYLFTMITLVEWKLLHTSKSGVLSLLFGLWNQTWSGHLQLRSTPTLKTPE